MTTTQFLVATHSPAQLASGVSFESPTAIPKTALITGASRGIGRSIALALARQGTHVALLARDRASLEAVASCCQRNPGVKTSVLPCDIRDRRACSESIDIAYRELGGLAVLINNAGVFVEHDVERIDSVLSDEVIDVNVKALMYTTAYALPYIRATPSGAIINICSVAGTRPRRGGAVYAASKQAILAFSRSLFQEVRADGVKVCAISPGYVATAMAQGRGLSLDRCMSANDVVRAVLYVLSQSRRVCPTEIVLEPQLSPVHA